jgi:hypothetical protein
MAFQAHVSIKGNKQGQFKGEGTQDKRKDKWIPVLAFQMGYSRLAMSEPVWRVESAGTSRLRLPKSGAQRVRSFGRPLLQTRPCNPWKSNSRERAGQGRNRFMKPLNSRTP